MTLTRPRPRPTLSLATTILLGPVAMTVLAAVFLWAVNR